MSLQAAIERVRQLDAGLAPPRPAVAVDGADPSSSPFATALRRAGGPAQPDAYDGLVQAAAARYGVDPGLVGAVLAQESGGDPTATSPVGAQGLMQLMPDTARSLGVTNPYDPAQSIDGGTRYLRNLLDRFGGSEELALAGYNAGAGAVERYGGVPPYPETQRYVENVLARAGRQSV